LPLEAYADLRAVLRANYRVAPCRLFYRITNSIKIKW